MTKARALELGAGEVATDEVGLAAADTAGLAVGVGCAGGASALRDWMKK